MSTISKFAGRVVCTKAQFDALAEKDPNKEYLVTDDDTYGGGKLYKHAIEFRFADTDYNNEYAINFVVYAATSEIADTISKFKNLYGIETPTCIVTRRGAEALGVGYLTNLWDDSSYPELFGYLGSWTPVKKAFPNNSISDTVTEL